MGKQTGIEYYFSVDKPQTNAFVAYVFWFATAASCFSGRRQENQGLWEFEMEFLYQIYTRKLWIWGCDMAKKMNSISAEISIDSAEISKAN